MKENKAKEEELWDDLVFPIQKMEENLKHCIFVFGKFATEFWRTVTCSVNLSKTRRKETTQVYLPTKGGIIGSPNPTLTLSTFADRLCPVCPETVQVSPSVMQL